MFVSMSDPVQKTAVIVRPRPKQLQFQVSYLADEDRMLLRASFPSGQSMAVWLTRRVTFGLFEGAEAISGITQPAAPREVKKAIGEFERQAAVAKADTKTPFKPAAPHPSLGDDIKLVVRVTLTAEGDKLVKVVFATKDKLDLGFSVPRTSFLQLWATMEKIVAEQSGWTSGAMPSAAGLVPASATRH